MTPGPVPPAVNRDLMLSLYRSLMEEVKARASSINTFSNHQNGIPSPFVREYCYLQLRMMCELIALACLVAHEDIVATSTSDLKKAYHPDEIMRQLEALNADFYPMPVTPNQTATGWHMGTYVGGPYLTKRDLQELYGRCGDVLHRGSLKKLVGAQRTPLQTSFADVQRWGQKVLNLLSAHRILRVGGYQVIVAFLQVNDLNGAVSVAFAEAPAPETPHGGS